MANRNKRLSADDWKYKLSSYITKTESGCWIYNGCKTPRGYPLIRAFGKMRNASRVVAHIYHGLDIEDENLVARHLCNNTSCVNPEHIAVGSQWDNMQDRRKAGNNIKITGRPRKEHCDRGHEYTPENTYLDNRARRMCRACIALREAKYNQSKAQVS